MIPINKIYIDSRHRTSNSKSNTYFEIQLQETINLPNNCICVVTDVVFKNCFTTIQEFKQILYKIEE